MAVTEEMLDLLRHAVGMRIDKPRCTHGRRNNFCVDVDGVYDQLFKRLVELGLAVSGVLFNKRTSRYYHVTPAGCAAIGLHKAGTKRAIAPLKRYLETCNGENHKPAEVARREVLPGTQAESTPA